MAILAEKIRVSPVVELLVSAKIDVPMAMGVLRPVILIPASMLTNLPPTQLDAILLHELAHIRRHDFLVNLLQTLVETLFFFHPAAWWISRRIREERENCCDDLAALHCENVREYAGALAALETLRGATPASALAADGGRPRRLLGRIRRLLRREGSAKRTTPAWPLVFLGMGALAGAVIASTMMAVAGEKEGDEKWASLQVSSIGNRERNLVCVHTDEKIHAIVQVPVTESDTSSSQTGVIKSGVGDKETQRLAFAEYRWNDDLRLRIEFDSASPDEILLNDQIVRLRNGRVIFWREAERWADQATVVAADLPETKTENFLRDWIIKEFAPEEGGWILAPREAGKWDLADGGSLEILRGRFAPGESTAIIRWPASEKWPALRHEILLGPDADWALAMEEDSRTLWLAGPQWHQRINFSDPENIVIDHANSAITGMPDAVRAELQKRFRLDKTLDKSGIPYIGGNLGHQRITAATLEAEYIITGTTLRPQPGTGGLFEPGTPLADVPVEAFLVSTSGQPVSTTRSDENGAWELRFRIGLDSLKNDRLLFIRPGLPGHHDRDLDAGGEFLLAIEAGESVEKLTEGKPHRVLRPGVVMGDTTFRLQKNAQPISGILRDSEGAPIADAWISVKVDDEELPWNDGNVNLPGKIADTAKTDAEGRFLLSRIPIFRELHLVASKQGESVQTEPYHFDVQKREIALNVVWGDSGLECQSAEPLGKVVEAEAPEKPIWTARGRVTDPGGAPLADVEISVHAGMGTLFRTGFARTDAEGRYEVEFTRGIHGSDSTRLEVAQITAHLPGFVEKNLSRHGDGAMAGAEVPENDLKNWNLDPETQLALPGKPRTVDFVMVPAVRVNGRLTGTGAFSGASPEIARQMNPALPRGPYTKLDRSPLGGWRVRITGDQLPPGSSVWNEVTTDEDGRFVFENVPAGFEWHFETDTNIPETARPLSRKFKLDANAGKSVFASLELKNDQRKVILEFTEGDRTTAQHTVQKEHERLSLELRQHRTRFAPRHPATMALSKKVERLDRLLKALKKFKYPGNGKNAIAVWRENTPRSGSFSVTINDDQTTLFDAIDSFEDRCAPMDKTAIAIFSENSSKVEFVDYTDRRTPPDERILKRGQLVILLAPPEVDPAAGFGGEEKAPENDRAAAESKSPRNKKSHYQPLAWSDAKHANLPFGPASDDGLRVARFFNPLQRVYEIGAKVEGRVVFHNNGKVPTEIKTEPWHQRDKWHCRDADGRAVKVDASDSLGFTGNVSMPFILQPGEVMELGAQGTVIGTVPYGNEPNGIYCTSNLPDAKHGDTITCAWDVTYSPKSTGEETTIRSGDFTFSIQARPADFPVDLGLARHLGKYHLAEGIQLQISRGPTETTATIKWDGGPEKSLLLEQRDQSDPVCLITWWRGGTAFWVVEDRQVRKVDFAPPENVAETRWDRDQVPEDFGGAPELVADEIRKHL